jgi:hypothetical protein
MKRPTSEMCRASACSRTDWPARRLGAPRGGRLRCQGGGKHRAQNGPVVGWIVGVGVVIDVPWRKGSPLSVLAPCTGLPGGATVVCAPAHGFSASRSGSPLADGRLRLDLAGPRGLGSSGSVLLLRLGTAPFDRGRYAVGYLFPPSGRWCLNRCGTSAPRPGAVDPAALSWSPTTNRSQTSPHQPSALGRSGSQGGLFGAILGWMMQLAGDVPVKRASDPVPSSVARCRNPAAEGVRHDFPEGTRSPPACSRSGWRLPPGHRSQEFILPPPCQQHRPPQARLALRPPTATVRVLDQ